MRAPSTDAAKRTPWYPPTVKPAHWGFYEATLFPKDKKPAPPRFFWNGREWWNVREWRPCDHQDRHWRGLKKRFG